MESTGYLLVNLSPLKQTFVPIVRPNSCVLISAAFGASLMISKCVNLEDGGLTVNKTYINQINPNIVTTNTIAVQFNENLAVGTDYSIQIITQNVLPALGSITSSFEAYTISGTGFML